MLSSFVLLSVLACSTLGQETITVWFPTESTAAPPDTTTAPPATTTTTPVPTTTTTPAATTTTTPAAPATTTTTVASTTTTAATTQTTTQNPVDVCVKCIQDNCDDNSNEKNNGNGNGKNINICDDKKGAKWACDKWSSLRDDDRFADECDDHFDTKGRKWFHNFRKAAFGKCFVK